MDLPLKNYTHLLVPLLLVACSSSEPNATSSGGGGTDGSTSMNTGTASAGGAQGAGGNTNSGTATGGTNSTAAASGGKAATGGNGGSGGVMGTECTGDETQACYSGPATTAGVGTCKEGTQTCKNGYWGPCLGEILPAAMEACDGFDDDCDGELDEGCMCTDGQTQSCCEGAAATLGVGTCQAGTQTCAQGAWGPCLNQVLPATETCDGKDNNCDGTTDDGNPDGGGMCQTSQPGECQAGAFECLQVC